MRPRTAHTVAVRPVHAADDGEFLAGCAWVAIDSAGRRFGAATEQAARDACDAYNHHRLPKHGRHEGEPE
jgi:hypothetical protein